MEVPSPTQLRKVAEGYPRWLTQVRGTVNDASCLNVTPVYGVARPTDIGEVRQALEFARTHDLAVVPSGTRHAMGGQNAAVGALVLDLRDMASVRIDPTRQTATVGAGAIWRDVLQAAHAHDLAAAAMPSIDTLSVGGTLSVNAHGADFRVGSLASTVRSLTLVTADGEVHQLSRTQEPELFGAVIGGHAYPLAPLPRGVARPRPRARLADLRRRQAVVMAPTTTVLMSVTSSRRAPSCIASPHTKFVVARTATSAGGQAARRVEA